LRREVIIDSARLWTGFVHGKDGGIILQEEAEKMLHDETFAVTGNETFAVSGASSKQVQSLPDP